MRCVTKFFALLAMCLAVFTSGTALAQEKSAIRAGFEFPADKSARILVLRPSIRVGEQSTGGGFEPRAEWTNQARTNIDRALGQLQGNLGNSIVAEPLVVGENAIQLNEFKSLFRAMAQSIIQYQFFVGNRLPTKKKDNKEGVFDWTLGQDIRSLPGADSADYALFIVTDDHYGSTGRKMLQIAAALTVGVGVSSGLHAGYAGLVDLRTGDIVWINADNQMGGDVRTTDGALKRVSQLLEEFPGRPATGITQ